MTEKYLKIVATWDGGQAEEWFDKKMEFMLEHHGLPNLHFSIKHVDFPPLRAVPDEDMGDD